MRQSTIGLFLKDLYLGAWKNSEIIPWQLDLVGQPPPSHQNKINMSLFMYFPHWPFGYPCKVISLCSRVQCVILEIFTDTNSMAPCMDRSCCVHVRSMWSRASIYSLSAVPDPITNYIFIFPTLLLSLMTLVPFFFFFELWGLGGHLCFFPVCNPGTRGPFRLMGLECVDFSTSLPAGQFGISLQSPVLFVWVML